MADEGQERGWVIRPSLWFDAVCLIPLPAKPLPAFLALWTSPAAGPSDQAGESLDGLVAAVADPEMLASAMREGSPHWSEADERLFRSVRPALLTVLEGLRAAGLAGWWAEHAADGLRRRCGELRRSFAGYDLVPLVEDHTGVRFDTRAVEMIAPTAAGIFGSGGRTASSRPSREC